MYINVIYMKLYTIYITKSHIFIFLFICIHGWTFAVLSVNLQYNVQ